MKDNAFGVDILILSNYFELSLMIQLLADKLSSPCLLCLLPAHKQTYFLWIDFYLLAVLYRYTWDPGISAIQSSDDKNCVLV